MRAMRAPGYFLLLILIGVFGLISASSTMSAAENTPPVLRVGVTPNSPPIIYSKGGKIVGIEAEFANLLAKRLGAELQFVRLPFPELLPQLGAGKIDIVMSGLTVSAVREPLAEFCTPYATSGIGLLVRNSDLWTFAYPDVIFLLETRIGVEKGTIADLIVQKRCPRAKRILFSSPEAAARALQAKKVDVVLGDAPVLWRVAAQNKRQTLTAVPRLLTTENLAWAVQRGDSELLTAANDLLRQLRADGTLQRILQTAAPLR